LISWIPQLLVGRDQGRCGRGARDVPVDTLGAPDDVFGVAHKPRECPRTQLRGEDVWLKANDKKGFEEFAPQG